MLFWQGLPLGMLSYWPLPLAVSESKALCHPSSVDSLSTSAATEDHVSMGGWAARKALRVVEHVEQGKASSGRWALFVHKLVFWVFQEIESLPAESVISGDSFGMQVFRPLSEMLGRGGSVAKAISRRCCLALKINN